MCVLVRKDTVRQGLCVLLEIGCGLCVLHVGVLQELLRLYFVVRGNEAEDIDAATSSQLA